MTKCFICGGEIKFLFSMGEQPLANKYPKSTNDFKNENIQEMKVYYCNDCNYVNLPCNIDRSVFFEDYYYLSSVNQELVDHFNEFALDIKERDHKLVLDVGSNDGILLRPLKSLGVNCIGVDPSENVSAIAKASGLDTITGFFDEQTVDTIQEKYGNPDLICASSVFTHFEDPYSFFELSNSLLSKNGAIILEIEYLGAIIDSLGFERFYFDRPHYYSIKSLSEIAKRVGFTIVDVSYKNVHGGSIRVIFQRKNEKTSDKDIENTIKNEDENLNREIIINKFREFEAKCKDLLKNIQRLKDEGNYIIAYGCPARFSTITNFASIGSNILPFVVEDSPLKQGRYSPGQHIPIIAYSDAESVDIFVVFAYEYIKSIKEKIKKENIIYYKPIPFSKI